MPWVMMHDVVVGLQEFAACTIMLYHCSGLLLPTFLPNGGAFSTIWLEYHVTHMSEVLKISQLLIVWVLFPYSS